MKRLTKVFPKQMLTGGLEHLLIKTPESIEVTAAEGSDEYFEQHRVLEHIVEMVRMRANVVIVGPVDADGVSIAVEFNEAVQADELEGMIQDLGEEVPFGSGTVDLSGVTVLKVDYKLDDPTP